MTNTYKIPKDATVTMRKLPSKAEASNLLNAFENGDFAAIKKMLKATAVEVPLPEVDIKAADGTLIKVRK